MSRSVDVVVVGAGVSGLVAARALKAEGVDVLVLEAAPRVGGRTLAATSSLGSRTDLGGAWIGHDHHRVRDLATELGLTPFPMHTGLMPRLIDGRRRLRLLSPSVLTAFAAITALDLLCRVRPRERWSAVSLESWLRRVPGRTARRLLEVIALVSWTADLDQISIRALTQMIRTQGGLRTVMTTKGGAQDSLLVEGMGAIAERIARNLGPCVEVDQRVVSISRDETGVTVRTGSQVVRAAAAIVTVPAPMAASIAHEPPLPPERTTLQDDTYMGTVYKAVAVYPTPFWRDGGGGEYLSLSEPGCGVFDTSPPQGPGHLTILTSGPDARALDALDPAQRQRAVLSPLAEHLGPRLLEPADWLEKAWHLDEFAGGGYIALPRLGSDAGLAPMPAKPSGRLHWAGAETATSHPGYVEGAVAAGLRVAEEVVEDLAHVPPAAGGEPDAE